MKTIDNVLNTCVDDYRAIPFWSWNDKLSSEMLVEQISEMKDKGLGGFMMHARGGLETEYLSDEWMDCIGACLEKAKETGMRAWCYDEEGWPSGFAGGAVPSIGYKNHMKYIRLSKITASNKINEERLLGIYVLRDGRIIKCDSLGDNEEGYCANIDTSPYYIDILNKDTVSDFISVTHQKYYDRFKEYFGSAMPGFFTDEPQYAKGQIPWTLNMEEIFFNEYGYDILSYIPALFIDVDHYGRIRNDYWKLVSKLYTENFGKQIHDWCSEHGVKLTGHVMSEDSLGSQMYATAGAMSFYEYFDIPGIDMLGRAICPTPIIPKQVGSVAAQLGKKQVLTETFALCGWDVGFDELKWIAEWQFVNGVNMICSHLQGYTLRGARKRDYPPSMFIQQPWWDRYKEFIDYFAKLGSLLGEGKDKTSVLLLHPIRSAHTTYRGPFGSDKVSELNCRFTGSSLKLSKLHIDHHYGDETLMAKYGSVDGDTLMIGECCYKTVVIPDICNISEEVLGLLYEFKNNGGNIYRLYEHCHGTVEGIHDSRFDQLFYDIPLLVSDDEILACVKSDSDISISCNGEECGSIAYTSRDFEDTQMYFLVNLDAKNSYDTEIKIPEVKGLTLLDLTDMSKTPIAVDEYGKAKMHFEPRRSCVILVENYATVESQIRQKDITVSEDFTIEYCDQNSLTLDICDYRVDGGEWVENTAIIVLQRLLLEMRKESKVDMRVRFNVKCSPDEIGEMFLAIECPEKFSAFSVNGNNVVYKDIGFFRDSSFKKINIKEYVRQGINEIILSCTYFQRQKVYDVLFGENVHETERNKLTFDVELESAYLVGDFGVYSESKAEEIERRAYLTDGPFYIDKAPKTLKKGDFSRQGLQFFAGSILVSQSVQVDKENDIKYLLRFNRPNDSCTDIMVNGKFVKTVGWTPYAVDITDFLVNGDNIISFRLFPGNRNLLGPHHYAGGESYNVGTGTFTDRAGWSDDIKGDIWRDSYCFVKFGLE